jgi:hypothetical protein
VAIKTTDTTEILKTGKVVDDWKKLLIKTIHPKIAHFEMNCFDQQLLMACQQL